MRKSFIGILLAAICFASHAEEIRKVPLELFVSKANVGAYPIEIGLPFPSGTLTDAAQIRLLGPDGEEIPCQVKELSRYVDGSLRAALLVFLSPVSKEKASTNTVEFGEGVARKAAPAMPIAVSEKDGAVVVDSGALQFRVGKGKPILSAVTAGDKEILPEGLDPFIQEAGREDLLFGEQTEVTIEEKGPIRSVILVTGRFGTAPDAHSYRVRIHAYAGTGLVRLQHTALGLDAKKPFELAGWGLRLNAGAKDAACGIDGAVKTLALSKGETVLQDDTFFGFEWGAVGFEEGKKKLRKTRKLALGEMPGWRHRMRLVVGHSDPVEGKADGWLSANTAGGGIAVCVRDFWQQCPKEFSGSEKDITVWLHSPRGRPFIAKAGTAKTHEMLLDFSSSAGNAEAARALNSVFQEWPHARVSPEWVCAGGVFGPLLPRSDPFTEHYNRIADVCLGYILQNDSRMPIVLCATWHMYGNADFGDVAKAIYNYNVPVEHTRAFTLEFLRGGDRVWARIAARAARHYGDIDVCHAKTEESDPGRPWRVCREAGQRMPWPFYGGFSSARVFQTKDLEALKAKIKESEEKFTALSVPRDVHQFRPARGGIEYWRHTGGAMPYYLLSGDRRSLEALEEQAKWIIESRAKIRDRHSLSFQLSALLDAHEATGAAKYLKGAASVVEDLIAWWKEASEKRRDLAKRKEQLASDRLAEWLKGGHFLKGHRLPTHGFWELSPVAGRPAESVTRRARSAFRFMELNVTEAQTGVDNEEVKRMLGECMEANMRAAKMWGCTPIFVYPWTKVVNLGLWSEDARKEFEEKTLFFLAAGRKDLYNKYVPLRNGLVEPYTLKYTLPFLPYKWSRKRKTGKFVPFDVEKMLSEYIGASALSPYLCHLHEMGLSFGLLNYPHFITEWKQYHEKYLKPRMNEEGILEFSITPAGETGEKAPEKE